MSRVAASHVEVMSSVPLTEATPLAHPDKSKLTIGCLYSGEAAPIVVNGKNHRSLPAG